METYRIIQIAIHGLFLLVNSFALFMVVIFVTKMNKRIESKVDYLIDEIELTSNKVDRQYCLVRMEYLNRLEEMKNMFVKAENFEEAERVQKAINYEMKQIKKEAEDELAKNNKQ